MGGGLTECVCERVSELARLCKPLDCTTIQHKVNRCELASPPAAQQSAYVLPV